MVVDVRQSQSRFSPDRTKLLDRMGGLDGRGHRDLNAQVRALVCKSLRNRGIAVWAGGRMMGPEGDSTGSKAA